MKKFLVSIMFLFMLFSLLPVAMFATENTIEGTDQSVKFTIGKKNYSVGSKLVETDAAPYIKDGRTMVPVAFVAPALGTDKAIWIPESQMIRITRGTDLILIKIGSKELIVNGKTLLMDTVAEILNVGEGGGRTMLPIAFIARALEIGYQWIPVTRTVEFYGYSESFNQSGTYGPSTGTKTITGNVVIEKDGVRLQNMVIKGNLIIAESVGEGTAYLDNITVLGNTFVRGGGKNSIYINGGSYANITIQKDGDLVRVVVIGVDNLPVLIATGAASKGVILEGNFASVTVEAQNAIISTQGATTIEGLTIAGTATGAVVTLGGGTTVA